MNFTLFSIKKKIKKVIQYIHNFLRLYNLSQSEVNGKYCFSTKFKLLNKTLHELYFSNGLTIRGVSFNKVELDPFGASLKVNGNDIDKHYFIDNIAKFFSEQEDMKINDLNDFFKDTKFGDYPLWTFTYPWDVYSVDEMLKYYSKELFENRSQYFRDKSSDLLLDSSSIALSHCNQFSDLFLKISSQGFDKSISRPRVIILIFNSEWRWILSGQGNHRSYILNLMGLEKLPCEISKVFNFNYAILNYTARSEWNSTNLIQLANKLFCNNSTPLRGLV